MFFEFEIGFNDGSVYWDDEDAGNANSRGGTLPSGSFDDDTRINYCCRYSTLSLNHNNLLSQTH